MSTDQTVLKTTRVIYQEIKTIQDLINSLWHLYVSINLITIGPGSGMLALWCQAILWTSAEILSMGLSGTNFNTISIKMQTIVLKKIIFKIPSAWCWPFCLDLNVLIGRPSIPRFTRSLLVFTDCSFQSRNNEPLYKPCLSQLIPSFTL